MQLADKVQHDVRVRFAQRRPFGLRFLHAVLAKDALPGSNQRGDVFCGVGLADRYKRDIRSLAPGKRGGGSDADVYSREQLVWLIHAALL